MFRLTQIALAAGLCVPTVAAAHPHVFVQAQVTLLFEADRPVGVQVDWVYDEFFSLLLTSDLGIDLDGDMRLSADEEVILAEAVTTWPQGFEGDLEVRQNGEVIPLGAKLGHTMSFEDGIVRETHVRVLPPMDSMSFEVQVFDPYYYVAYDLIQIVRLLCKLLIWMPPVRWWLICLAVWPQKTFRRTEISRPSVRNSQIR